MLLTKTYEVQDLIKYAPTEISKTSSITTFTKEFPYDFDFSSEHFEMLCDVKYPNTKFAVGLSPSTNSSAQYNISLGITGDGTNKWRTYKPTSATTNEGTSSNVSATLNSYVSLKLVYDNGSCSIYVNDTLIITYTGMSSLYQSINKTVGLQHWDTGTIYLKNLKVKPL